MRTLGIFIQAICAAGCNQHQSLHPLLLHQLSNTSHTAGKVGPEPWTCQLSKVSRRIGKKLFPRHRNDCDPCSRVLETLVNLQVSATRCERFFLLLRPQQLIRSQSLPALAQSSSTWGKDHLDITILLLGSPRSLPKTKWPLVWQLTGTTS